MAWDWLISASASSRGGEISGGIHAPPWFVVVVAKNCDLDKQAKELDVVQVGLLQVQGRSIQLEAFVVNVSSTQVLEG